MSTTQTAAAPARSRLALLSEVFAIADKASQQITDLVLAAGINTDQEAAPTRGAVSALLDMIQAAPAESFADLCVKMRAALWLHDGRADDLVYSVNGGQDDAKAATDTRLAFSILRDLARLSTEGGAQ